MKSKTNGFFVMFAFFVLLIASASPAATEPVCKLIVNISGFPNSEGFAMVALANSEESYNGEGDSAIAMQKVAVVGQKVEVVFANLPYGWYGVSIYHDENANGKLDKYAMGIPREAYGFSNNARGFFGKPGYKDVKFPMNSVEKQITIKLE